MKRLYRAVFTLVIVSLFIHCAEDPYVNDIDPSFMSYFESFIDEGQKRNYVIDLSAEKINARFRPSVNGEVGQCAQTSSGIKNLYFDPSYWQRSDAWQREFLIYHELGHCLLGRSHDNSKDSQGRCMSMMNSGTGDCRSNYNSTTRDTYLDELFLSL